MFRQHIDSQENHPSPQHQKRPTEQALARYLIFIIIKIFSRGDHLGHDVQTVHMTTKRVISSLSRKSKRPV